MRSMPIRWCASGSAIGSNRRTQSAWKAAHGRIFEHLRDTTKEGNTPTLEELAPLYQAIGHGCRAGRHQEALDNIYVDRICRRLAGGALEFYASQTLGALGSDLAAMSWFFDKPYADSGGRADAGGPSPGCS